MLQLLRDDVRDFLLEYALFGNRDVHALRLDVAPDIVTRLHERFEARQRAGERQRERLALLREDRRLLEQASGARAAAEAADALLVPAAGYFASALPAPAPRRPASVMAELRARIEAHPGAEALAPRIEALRRERAALLPFVSPEAPLADVESEPPLVYAWSARQLDLASAQTALELLRDAAPLRGDALVQADATQLLGSVERAALCAFREPLASDLADLATGTRPDWGRAFLVGAARLLALDASCQSGELQVLDALSGMPESESDLPAPQPEALRLRAGDAADALAEARALLFGAAWSERRYTDLEELANQRVELLRAAAQGGRLRVPEARLVPERPAPRLDLPSAPLEPERLVTLALLARQRETQFSNTLARLHAYHLVTQNCVTEIFGTLHAALGSREQIEAALGARIDPASRGRFVPFVSARAVRDAYRIAAQRSIPSLRSARVARIAERDGSLALLRELSPWTAAGYERAASDSVFLFFSDGAPALRPLFGLANLAAGTGEMLFGLFWAPRDGGARLRAGLRGAFWSLPELAFFSVRKGANDYVSPEWIAKLDAQIDAWDQAASAPTATLADVGH